MRAGIDRGASRVTSECVLEITRVLGLGKQTSSNQPTVGLSATGSVECFPGACKGDTR
jgi:hypothetical protein